MLRTQQLMVEQAEVVWHVLRHWGSKVNKVNFVDGLIAVLCQQAACEQTVTFDQHALKHQG